MEFVSLLYTSSKSCKPQSKLYNNTFNKKVFFHDKAKNNWLISTNLVRFGNLAGNAYAKKRMKLESNLFHTESVSDSR